MADTPPMLAEMTRALDELRLSIDRRDATAISAATHKLAQAVDAMRSYDAAAMPLEERRVIEAMLPMIDSARRKVNVAADDVRKRIDLLAQKGVGTAVPVYGR